MDYQKAISDFNNDKIRELSTTTDGLSFLKLRSLSRKKEMEYLIERANLDFGNTSSRTWLKQLYEANIPNALIDQCIDELYEIERSERRANEGNLINELYKVQSFGWGGLHQNSLEKTIVNNYVKKIRNYDVLSSAIENDLHHSMRAYVLASWYNHWTSIIIEDIFKDHSSVRPAVGLIKKIDFFVEDVPFDLKVTYLPEGYIKGCRKELGLRPEITLLKKQARELKITYDKNASESVLIPDLWHKLEDSPHSTCNELVNELQTFREKTLDNSIHEPKKLARWLYENQGVRRFDASNRLFLVLVDKNNFFESWKLKRAQSLIQSKVSNCLNKTSDEIGFQMDFKWEGHEYTTVSDIIFVTRN